MMSRKRRGYEVTLRDDALAAYKAWARERREREERERVERLARTAELLRERFRYTFGREPDSVNAELESVSLDGITLIFRSLPSIGCRWYLVSECPMCSWHRDWEIASLVDLGRALAEEESGLRDHDCVCAREGLPFGEERAGG